MAIQLNDHFFNIVDRFLEPSFLPDGLPDCPGLHWLRSWLGNAIAPVECIKRQKLFAPNDQLRFFVI